MQMLEMLEMLDVRDAVFQAQRRPSESGPAFYQACQVGPMHIIL